MTTRALVLAAILAVGAGALFLVGRSGGPPTDDPRLTWVATARQLGVVGYRDPAGVISPDGTRVAYSEGRDVRVVPIGGGAPVALPPADGQVRHLAWGPGALIAEDARGATRWWTIDPDRGTRTPLLGGLVEIAASAGTGTTTGAQAGTPRTVRTNTLRNIVPSPDGVWIAATAAGRDGPELWRMAMDGSRAEVRSIDGRLSAPAWTPSGAIACIVTRDGRSRISKPCGDPPLSIAPDMDVVGPVAFSPDESTVYFAVANDRGMVDLWSADLRTARAARLTNFDRDAYAPSTALDGTVLFKTQSYRTFVAETDLASGRSRQLATFQSETPSYDPTGRRVAVTFGTWRRVIDDAGYPDIAQEIGLIPAGPDATAAASEPASVIAASPSEDQAMTWSPNGKWIALHSHREMSDDVWLRPADGSKPDERITFLGRGAEVGWPRWSPDGRTVLLDGASAATGQSVLYVIGVDQDSGRITSPLRQIDVTGIEADLDHAEWLGGSETVVAIGREGPGRHVIVSLPAAGGRARVVHRFATEHDLSGLAASPDGREVAFVQRASDGFFQIFRLALDGRTPPAQVTVDPSDKTQPAWSPDGARIAYTVWSYLAHFWTLGAGEARGGGH